MDFIADLTRIGRMVKRATRGEGEQLLGEIMQEAAGKPIPEHRKCQETSGCEYERNHSGACCIVIKEEAVSK